jgi:hypothetical protein
MYIGATPQIGNYQVCDALSASATATYALTVSSVAVFPESSFHVICSLNGVIQKPGSSFSISGSNIVFSSALTSSDSINFIILLGSTLDVGIVSDATITNAKLASDLISGETDIGGAIADADLFLVDDGAGGTLRKTAASRLKTYVGGGLPGLDMWRVTADITSNAQPISSNWERVDTGNFTGIGTAFSAPSSGIWTFPSTGIWEIVFEVHLSNSGGDAVCNSAIQVTTNNSSYTIRCYSQTGDSGDFKDNFTARTIIDVTDTANVKFKVDIDNVNGSTIGGDTNNNQTYIIMKKLGET